MATPTEQQIKFVDAYLANGGNGTQAALAAGYAASCAHVKASKLLRLSHVQEAFRGRLMAQVESHAPLAVGVLAEVAANPEAKDRDRIAAATAILDRTKGLQKGLRHEVEHTFHVDPQKIIQELEDQRKVRLEHEAKLIEGEAVEVTTWRGI